MSAAHPDVCPPNPTAAQWDTWYLTGTVRRVTQFEEEQFYRLAAPRPGQTAVDIGCGVGPWTRQLARWGLTVTGYDHSAEAIKRARRLAGPRERYQMWDADAAPVPPDHAPGSVDIVTCRLSLPYLNWPRLRAIVVRWLAADGAFHALIPIDHDSTPDSCDPYRRGMTEDQIRHLADGWAVATRYRTRSRHLTGLILRDWRGQPDRESDQFGKIPRDGPMPTRHTAPPSDHQTPNRQPAPSPRRSPTHPAIPRQGTSP